MACDTSVATAMVAKTSITSTARTFATTPRRPRDDVADLAMGGIVLLVFLPIEVDRVKLMFGMVSLTPSLSFGAQPMPRAISRK